MTSVRVRENEPFEAALRRFKRTIEKTGLLTELRAREVDERKTLSDADVVAVIDKMVKQRKDSITQFDAGNRADLADVERAELVILQAYLPAPLSDAEIDAAIDREVTTARAAGATGP